MLVSLTPSHVAFGDRAESDYGASAMADGVCAIKFPQLQGVMPANPGTFGAGQFVSVFFSKFANGRCIGSVAWSAQLVQAFTLLVFLIRFGLWATQAWWRMQMSRAQTIVLKQEVHLVQRFWLLNHARSFYMVVLNAVRGLAVCGAGFQPDVDCFWTLNAFAGIVTLGKAHC